MMVHYWSSGLGFFFDKEVTVFRKLQNVFILKKPDLKFLD